MIGFGEIAAFTRIDAVVDANGRLVGLLGRAGVLAALSHSHA